MITEEFAYDGGRLATAYTPSRHPELMVFAGDGPLITSWGPLIDRDDIPATLIIGAHPTSNPDEMARIAEYSPTIDPPRFAAHEAFFLDVMAWAAERFGAFPPDRTVIAGASAGAELALAMAARRPNRFGAVFAASPGGGYHPPTPIPTDFPPTYLTAGTGEPFFADNARRWVEALESAGVDVSFTEPEGRHGGPFWVREFATFVRRQAAVVR